MSNKKQKGFTLLEILVAFTLLALTFGAVMEIITGSAKNTVKASQNTKIAMLVQSKMDELGLLERLEEGSSQGDFDYKTSWTLEVTPYDVINEGGSDQEIAAIELLQVTLIVLSELGSKQYQYEFNTLRAVTVDNSRGR
jgi:general secretion pathway protein I